MQKRFPKVLVNRTSLVGAALAAVSAILIVFLSLVEQFARHSHPYMGLITFIALPVGLDVGLLLVVGGAVRTHRRLKRGEPTRALPHLDLNNRRHVRWIATALTVLTLFLFGSAFGSYKAYEYTETVEFCGRVCHAVMKPEYTAYQNSPHAKVDCVQCHIGPGATWFVRSKISGSYQFYSVCTNKFSRPIQTPVENLRPSRETCETCHWPQQFYSQKLLKKTYFLSDDNNTRGELGLAMKVGGGDPEHGNTDGIHWSMYLSHQVTYVATDRSRSVIPYIESRDKSGKVTVYRSTETPITPVQLAKGARHLVDCIECHNRPSHRFHPPAEAVDQALTANRIDPTLPEIKRLAVECLEKPYKTEDEAVASIRRDIEAFYRTSHPEVAQTRQAAIASAAQQTQDIYRRDYFPEMRTNWKAFPDHLGHKYSDGCFRCHDGKHVTETGKVLTNSCTACHTIQGQSNLPPQQANVLNQIFKHPIEIGDVWKTTKCTECHKPAK